MTWDIIKDLLPYAFTLISTGIIVGVYKNRIDNLEKRIDKFDSIESRLSSMESKIDLLVQGKIKINE
jgi:hypothetical protein